jgi:hypothetical protein
MLRLAGLSALLCLSFIGLSAHAEEHWPTVTLDPKVVADLIEPIDSPYAVFHDLTYKDYFVRKYTPFGDYLKWGQKKWRSDGEIILSKSGLPRVSLNGTVYDNPVTLAQFALSMHGKILRGDRQARGLFLAAVDKLVEMEGADGGFHYPIPYEHHGQKLAPGWTSALAQGQALSAFARAWNLTKERKYLKAGDLAIRNLLKPIKLGGQTTTLAGIDPSLARYRFYEEYPISPVYYTLNGFMFTLLGIYDWSNVPSPSQAKAKKAFDEGMLTLSKLIGLYDVNGFSSYDLFHIVTKSPSFMPYYYESIHVYLLQALNSIKPTPSLTKKHEEWEAKLDAANKPLRFGFDGIKLSAQSPQPVGSDITITLIARSSRKTKRLFQIGAKYKGVWTFPFPWQENNVFVWHPSEAGEYGLGFYVKAPDTKAEYETFRAMTYQITDKPAQAAVH